jgi:phytoene desaturase
MEQVSKKVLIIGSGLGSLATALRLTTHGYKVEILEKHHQAGGQIKSVEKRWFHL